MAFKGYFDGACSQNPGKMGIGATISDINDTEVDWAHAYIANGTNNRAEYESLILLLSRAAMLKIKVLDCYGDSQLIINQVNGTYKCNTEELLPLYRKVQLLIPKFHKVTFNWIPRKDNSRADDLSKKALLMQSDDNALSKRKILPATEQKKKRTRKKITKAAHHNNKRPISVKALDNGQFLIIDLGQPIILDPTSNSCNCREFHEDGYCIHLQRFKQSKHITTHGLVAHRRQSVCYINKDVEGVSI